MRLYQVFVGKPNRRKRKKKKKSLILLWKYQEKGLLFWSGAYLEPSRKVLIDRRYDEPVLIY